MHACFVVLQLRYDSCQIHGYVMLCYTCNISVNTFRPDQDNCALCVSGLAVQYEDGRPRRRGSDPGDDNRSESHMSDDYLQVLGARNGHLFRKAPRAHPVLRARARPHLRRDRPQSQRDLRRSAVRVRQHSRHVAPPHSQPAHRCQSPRVHRRR